MQFTFYPTHQSPAIKNQRRIRNFDVYWPCSNSEFLCALACDCFCNCDVPVHRTLFGDTRAPYCHSHGVRGRVRVSLSARGQCPGQYRPGHSPCTKQMRTPVRPGIMTHITSTFVDYSPGWCPRADNVIVWTYSPGWCPRADNVTVWTYSPGWSPRADNVTMWTNSPGSRANSIMAKHLTLFPVTFIKKALCTH